MIDAWLLDWLNLVLRWAHVVVGIAWIGSSFYFFWLDSHLNVPPRDPEDERVAGDLWAVHGGGFYHAQKYRLAPGLLPEPLHWFKWEAYSTWLTGFALLVVLYYAQAGTYLVDPAVRDLSAPQAIGLSIAILIAGWLVYDACCRLLRDDRRIAAAGTVLVILLCWGATELFGGRGAFMQVGATLGTLMAANVFFVIIPAQKELVAACQRGAEPDPGPGLRARQRSLHNNYLTLPVVFVMISHHYAATYGHAQNWLVLLALFAAGVLVRHWFNLRHRGRNVPALVIAAVVLLGALAWSLRPDTRTGGDAPGAGAIPFALVRAVIDARCVACHSGRPTHASAAAAPSGVLFDTDVQVVHWATRIHERSVVSRTMPLANLTGMTNAERDLIDRWYRAMTPR